MSESLRCPEKSPLMHHCSRVCLNTRKSWGYQGWVKCCSLLHTGKLQRPPWLEVWSPGKVQGAPEPLGAANISTVTRALAFLQAAEPECPCVWHRNRITATALSLHITHQTAPKALNWHLQHNQKHVLISRIKMLLHNNGLLLLLEVQKPLCSKQKALIP